MGYYTGEALERRVKAFGLEQARDLLSEVGTGKRDWPGPLHIVPEKPEELEQLRVTVYSILHELGLKPQFQVSLGFGHLRIEQKKRSRAIVRFATGSSVEGPDDLEPLGDEGLGKMMEE
jgi:hypothetical protein